MYIYLYRMSIRLYQATILKRCDTFWGCCAAWERRWSARPATRSWPKPKWRLTWPPSSTQHPLNQVGRAAITFTTDSLLFYLCCLYLVFNCRQGRAQDLKKGIVLGKLGTQIWLSIRWRLGNYKIRWGGKGFRCGAKSETGESLWATF